MREQDSESNDLPLRIDKTAKILPNLRREIEAWPVVRGTERVIWESRPGRWAAGCSLQNLGVGQREPATLAAETREQRELRRLQQENDSLRQQRDILKKALGILSAEVPPHATR